jgi:hypothetical protein
MPRNSRPNRALPIAIVIVMLLIVAALVTFPLWRPLLVDDVVSESFPTSIVVVQEQPTVEAAASIPTVAEGVTISNATVPTAVAAAAIPTVTVPSALTSGSFVTIDSAHGAQGSASIYEADGGRVLRFEDFRSTNGPDLYVVLSRAQAPRSHAELGEDFVNLGRLKGNVGSQNYDLPADLDLSGYNSVVIYCLQFQVVFSTATFAG